MPRRKGGGVTLGKAGAVKATPTTASTLTSTDSPASTAIRTNPKTPKDVTEAAVTPFSTPVNPRRTENKKPRGGTFPDRLQWKMSHLNMPTTSTPKLMTNTKPQEVTQKDVETAFGFDDSCEISANYSTLISPIAHSSPHRLIPPVWKVNPLSQRNIDCDPPPTTDGVKKRNLRSPRRSKSESSVVALTELNPVKEVQPSEDQGNVDPPPSEKASPKKIILSSRTRSKSKDVVPRVKPAPSSDAKKVPSTRKTRSNSKEIEKVPSTRRTRSRSKDAGSILKYVTRGKKKDTKRPLLFDDIPEDEDDGPSPFSQLLHRYNEDDEKEEELELHVDPKKIVKTYASRKRVKYSVEKETEYDFVPTVASDDEEPEKKKQKIKRGRRAKKPSKKDAEEDDMDEEARKWLEEKNKEFEDVLKIPLVIESSFSD